MNFEDYKKSDSFTTPEGYFEKLDRDILEATCRKSNQKTKKRLLPNIMSYAAMVALTFLVAAGVMHDRKGRTATIVADATSVASLSEALEDNEFVESMLTEYPIDEYTFYCYMTNTNF